VPVLRRRTVLGGLLAAATVAAARYASAGEPAGAAARWTPTPILASTRTSSLAPRPVTAYVPVPGSAPSRRCAVGVRDLGFSRGVDRPLPTRVWYPASGGTPGSVTAAAAPARGRFPVVVFSHGLASQPNDYAAMLVRWARAGFVVAAPIYPHTSHGTADFNSYDIVNQPADASQVLTQLLALNGSADPLSGRLDPDRVAAAGHSAGGITTVGLFSAARDARLKAGIVLAGTDFRSAPFTGAPAAMLFVHGEKDDTVAYAAGHTVYEAVPWSRAMLTLPDAGHQVYEDGFEAVTGTSVEFLRWSLYGDDEARRRIPARAAAGGVATLEEQLTASAPDPA
jgi:dienelactone hydrolase